MRTMAFVVAIDLALLAACGSKQAAMTTGSGGNGAGTSSSGSGTTTTTGGGATTTTGASTGGAGGAGTTTTTASSGATTGAGGACATGSTGAGGSCATIPTFAEVLAGPLSSCSGLEPPCHNAGAGSLTINPSKATATWKQLVNHAVAMQGVGGVRVAPCDPQNSFVYRKLTDDLTANEQPPMPEPPGNLLQDAGWTELPPDDIEMVRCWILGGALDN